MYLNAHYKTMNKEEIRLTLTVDVFKYNPLSCHFLYGTCLTLTVDVFKLYKAIADSIVVLRLTLTVDVFKYPSLIFIC